MATREALEFVGQEEECEVNVSFVLILTTDCLPRQVMLVSLRLAAIWWEYDRGRVTHDDVVALEPLPRARSNYDDDDDGVPWPCFSFYLPLSRCIDIMQRALALTVQC